MRNLWQIYTFFWFWKFSSTRHFWFEIILGFIERPISYLGIDVRRKKTSNKIVNNRFYQSRVFLNNFLFTQWYGIPLKLYGGYHQGKLCNKPGHIFVRKKREKNTYLVDSSSKQKNYDNLYKTKHLSYIIGTTPLLLTLQRIIFVLHIPNTKLSAKKKFELRKQ